MQQYLRNDVFVLCPSDKGGRSVLETRANLQGLQMAKFSTYYRLRIRVIETAVSWMTLAFLFFQDSTILWNSLTRGNIVKFEVEYKLKPIPECDTTKLCPMLDPSEKPHVIQEKVYILLLYRMQYPRPMLGSVRLHDMHAMLTCDRQSCLLVVSLFIYNL